jgi:hypothetical protein
MGVRSWGAAMRRRRAGRQTILPRLRAPATFCHREVKTMDRTHAEQGDTLPGADFRWVHCVSSHPVVGAVVGPVADFVGPDIASTNRQDGTATRRPQRWIRNNQTTAARPAGLEPATSGSEGSTIRTGEAGRMLRNALGSLDLRRGNKWRWIPNRASSFQSDPNLPRAAINAKGEI